MPKIGLSLRQGSRVARPIPAPPSITAYEDKLATWGYADASFVDRQWFTSSASANILYGQEAGGNGVKILGGAAGKHCLVHFDCLKEQYPLFDLGTMYGGGGQIVYGGVYGHALYQSVGYRSAGYPPIFTSPSNAMDANGWQRYRPALRTLTEGKAVQVRFKLEVINPTGLFYTAGNTIRIGLLGSDSGNFVNADNVGPTDNVFLPYTGYMIGIGSTHKIYKRAANVNGGLILSLTAYTQLANIPMAFNPTQNPYLPPRDLYPILQVDLTIGRSGGNAYINSIVTGHNGNGDVVDGIQQIITDTPDALSFNTLAVGCVANSMESFRVSDVKIAYT
jgi:hypothetical protein